MPDIHALLNGATISGVPGSGRGELKLLLSLDLSDSKTARHSIPDGVLEPRIHRDVYAESVRGKNMGIAATVLRWVNGRWTNSPRTNFENVLPYFAFIPAGEPIVRHVGSLASGGSVKMQPILSHLSRLLTDRSEARKFLSQAVDEYCNAVLDGEEHLMTPEGPVSGPEAFKIAGTVGLGPRSDISELLTQVLGLNAQQIEEFREMCDSIGSLQQRIGAVAIQRGIFEDFTEPQQSALDAGGISQELPKQPGGKDVAAAFSLGLAAARVEMWAAEALTDERKAQMRGFSPHLRERLEKSLGQLTTALDRNPISLDEVRDKVAAMARPLLETLKTVNFGSERLRTGVAASVTYAAMVGERSQFIDPDIARVFGGEHTIEFQRVLAAGKIIATNSGTSR